MKKGLKYTLVSLGSLVVLTGVGLGIMYVVSPYKVKRWVGIASSYSDVFVDRLKGQPYTRGGYDGIDVSKHNGVIKFEMVNGKKTYKSFTFKLNPKEMAKFKTEATVKKKVAEYVAKSGVYKPSELQNLKYDMKEFLEEWKKMVPVVEAEELAKLDKSPNNPETRVTPHLISRLAAGEIFVFGSNAMGYHDGGAAKTALEKFGDL